MERAYIFLLGAGASTPEMPIYRGVDVKEKASVNKILEQSMKVQISPFYQYLKKHFLSEKWLIITQNIDRLADRAGLPTIPVHLRIKADNISLDEKLTEDMVVKSGEDIDQERMEYLCEKVREITLTYSDNLIVVIIGTSLPYSYLREVVIDPAKNMGAKVIHINPDENYNKIIDDINNDREFRTEQEILNFKPQPILKKDEQWWRLNAYDGIKKLFEF